MLLFQNEYCIPICLKNKNAYARLAVDDLRADFSRVSYANPPRLIEEEEECCLIIEDTPLQGDPLLDESFSISCDGKKITLSANTYLGTVWGIYTFSERILGVHPCYLFNDLPIEKKTVLEIKPFQMQDAPSHVGFRGFFINDEDLLTDWKEGGGMRLIDYPWYKTTVAPKVMDAVVETALRLRLNLVIPASFLDIDNPPEKALADCVARRGIYLSQHHIEPLGLSCAFRSRVSWVRVSTWETSLFTNANRFRSAASTAFFSVRSTAPWAKGAAWLFPSCSTAASTTCFRPSAEVDTVSTTGQPSLADKVSMSISVFFFSLMSALFSATTVGTPSSKSWVVKNKLRLKLVASTMFTITSGFSFFT